MAKSSLKKIVDRKNLFYLYALAICVMNGKQTILWQPANKGKKKGRGGAAGKSSSNKSGFGYKMWSNLQAAFGLAASTSHHHGNSSNNPEGIDSSNQVETRSPSAALRSPIKR
eukprot:gene7641-8444_t